MSSHSDARSPVMRFCDNFFQERNIKWMLGVGMLILLGSSLMLVTSHWDTYTPVWKHFILIGYTAVVFGAGEITYFRWGLRRTGTGLMALTVLLMPITFLALRWMHAGSEFTAAELLRQVGILLLLVLNTGFSAIAARRIFGHFLRGSQPTFLVSYLILCVAGAIVPSLPSGWAAWGALCLWGVFTVGTVKVNRHVFWLTEEHRLPRIFGFFPIGLLGLQFITLLAVGLVRGLPLQWIGLGLVLVAIPVLLTADAVAGVFQQRTGDLVRPYPWSIVIPFFSGLTLCAAGMCLAATGLPQPFAMVPASALAAGLMAVIARRTNNSAFVWAMLVGIALAYNFSPVFFSELARTVVQHGAMAVKESRLPLAFYGLTYLPLLIVLSIAARRRVNSDNVLFARPTRRFAVAVACLLLAASFGHEKAVFPVGLALTGLWALQTALFQDRRLMVLGIAAWIAAGFGLAPFLSGVWQLDVPHDMRFMAMASAAGLLLWPGRLLDRLSLKLPTGDRVDLLSTWLLCQLSSLALTLTLAVLWGLRFGLNWGDPVPWLSGTALSLLLVVQALIWLKPGLGEAALVFIGLNALVHAAAQGIPFTTMIASTTWGLAVLWSLTYVLARIPAARVARAFAPACYHVSLIGLTLGLATFYLPQFVAVMFGASVWFSWCCGALVVLWAFDAARRVPHRLLTSLGCASVLAICGAAVLHAHGLPAWQWLPAVWASVAVAAVPLLAVLRRRVNDVRDSGRGGLATGFGGHRLTQDLSCDAIVIPLDLFVKATLTAVAVISLLHFTMPLKLAGVVAVVGLLWDAVGDRRLAVRQRAGLLLNWHLIGAVVNWSSPDIVSVFRMFAHNLVACVLPVALTAGLSLLAWQLPRVGRATQSSRLVSVHRVALRLLVILGLTASLELLPTGLTPAQFLFALSSFAAIIVSELWAACRQPLVEAGPTADSLLRKRETRAWVAQAVLGAAAVYFGMFEFIDVTSSTSMYFVLAAGIVAWIVGRLSAQSPRSIALARPLTQTALVLPLITVGIGIERHLLEPAPTWKGLNSLALLFAGGFYFWRGLERKQKPFLVLAAAIVNVALALLWRERQWWDPQFFMIPLGISVLGLVELLKHEIPNKAHDPLRYLGALVILVSPTFHIVGGSWLHLVTLMVCSVLVTLVAIGIRVRALMYTGTAFLVADLVAMVVRGSIDQPNLLWISGIGLGAAVIAVAAYCENHRERILQRLRLIAADLETWE